MCKEYHSEPVGQGPQPAKIGVDAPHKPWCESYAKRGMVMEIEKVRKILTEVALDHSGMSTEEAIKNLALALLHIADSVHGLESESSAILAAVSET